MSVNGVRNTATVSAPINLPLNAATSQYDSLLGDYPGAHKSQARAWAVVDAGARALAEALELDQQLATDAVEEVARDTAVNQSEQLPEDAFNRSDAFRKTGVRTRIVTVEK